jgi:4-hydroxy-3-polyprenylbenzoate decarboxylase
MADVYYAALRGHARSEVGKRNVGMYRMQVYDGKTTGMHWQRQKVAAEHMRERCGRVAGCLPDAVDLMA